MSVGCLLSLMTLIGLLCSPALATPTLSMDRRNAVEGLSLALTCELSSGSPQLVVFQAGGDFIVNCSSWYSPGTCDVSNSTAYRLTANSRTGEITLTVQSFSDDIDGKRWLCTHNGDSNTLSLEDSSSILQLNEATAMTPRMDKFPMAVNMTSSLSLVLNLACARGQAEVTARLSSGQTLPSTSTVNTEGCDQTETGEVLIFILNGNDPSLGEQTITVNISVEHDSFSPENGYKRFITRGPIQFPVPLSSLSFTNNPDPVLAGQSTTLTCESSPTFPVTTISWFKNAQVISSGVQNTTIDVREFVEKTTSMLTLTPTEADNGQEISCEGNNGLGSLKIARIVLDVLFAPSKPSVTPMTVNVLEERETTLTCRSQNPGNPECNYQWWKDTTFITNGTDYSFTTRREDNGAKIKCLAENRFTRSSGLQVASDETTFNVYYRPRVNISESTLSLNEGDTLDLTCSADSNPTPPDFQWTTSTGVLANRARLTVPDIRRDQHDYYSCEASVEAPVFGLLKESKTVAVTVNYPPDITMSDANISEDDEMRLTCTASGRPDTYQFKPFVQKWGGNIIGTWSGTQSGSSYTMTRNKSSFQDNGIYECNVNNGIRSKDGILEQTRIISVTVRAAPVFVNGQTISTERLNADVVLTHEWYSNSGNMRLDTASVSGRNVPVTVTFRPSSVTLNVHGASVIQNGIRATLKWTLDEASRFGVYTFTMCNSVGCRNRTVSVVPTGPPLPPLQFKAINASAESIWLRWKPNFPGSTQTQYFEVLYSVRGSGENWTTIEVPEGKGEYTYHRVLGLQQATEYGFKLRARNQAIEDNKSPYVDEIYARTTDLSTELGHGVAIGVGSTLGVTLLMVIGFVLVYRFRHNIKATSFPCLKRRNGESNQSEGRKGKEDSDYSDLQLAEGTPAHTYEGIDMKTRRTRQGEAGDHYMNTAFHTSRTKPAVLPKPKQAKKKKAKAEDQYMNTDFHKTRAKPAVLPKPKQAKNKNDCYYENVI